MDEIEEYNKWALKFYGYCLMGALSGIIGLIMGALLDPSVITTRPLNYCIFSGMLGFWILVLMILAAKTMENGTFSRST